MNEYQHPIDNPTFNPNTREKVWYLSHPLAPDERYTFEENMEHVKIMLRMCFDEGFRVIAPYHTICLCLDDNNPEHRKIGLETDCSVAYALGRIILTGHKVSRGMSCEVYAAVRRMDDYVRQNVPSMLYYQLAELKRKCIINLTGLNDNDARAELKRIKISG